VSIATFVEQHLKPANPQPTCKPLAAALSKLEITPLDRQAVDTYKKETLDLEWNRRVNDHLGTGWTDLYHFHHQDYMPGLRKELGDTWTDEDRYLLLQDASGINIPRMICMGWHRMSVEATRDIPEFVQRKMAQISAEVPGVSFAADVLESERMAYDPFLIAKLDDEEIYVEVWGDDDHRFSR